MYKYIALDFDGTLLRPNHDISERSVTLLKKLQAQGIIIILCSGRNVSQMNFVAEKIDSDQHDTFIISDNGGVVTEIDNGVRTTLRNLKFDEDQFKVITNIVDGRTNVLSTFNDGQRYLSKFRFKEVIRALVRFHEVAKIGIPQTASKILLIDKKEHIEKVYQSVSDDVLNAFPKLNVFRSVPTLIEITPEGSTKGQGLQLVFEQKGWDIKDLIVFGDGENDISMFEVAGKAVAMENAFDTVKAKADEICLSNAVDGVAQYLEAMYASVLD